MICAWLLCILDGIVYIQTLTRQSWIHYTDCWIVK